jgi:SAM-dependent methyltransferase
VHRSDTAPIFYDDKIYSPDSYHTFIWDLQRPFLLQAVSRVTSGRGAVRYLDFACGTGRIIAVVEPLVNDATGLDFSPEMLAHARPKVSRAVLKHGDILTDADVVDHDYDLITAFRFFLNTEPEMRLPIMATLARRLAGPESRLIFNVHGNRWSAYQSTSLWNLFRARARKNTMSFGDVRRLLDACGLEIESWYGFGVTPKRLHQTRLAPLMRRVDAWASRCPGLRRVSQDMLFVCRKKDGADEREAALSDRLNRSGLGA